MTNLEFIEKEIEEEKITIIVNTSLLSHFDKEDDVANNVLSTKIMKAEDRLKNLKQIKYILEAWYSIKQGIMICEDKVDEDSYYEYLQFDEELFDELESEEAGERLNPIKKALEVEE